MAAFEAIEAGLDRLDALDFHSVTTPERLSFLQRSERIWRRLPTHQHRLINLVDQESVPEQIGGDQRSDPDGQPRPPLSGGV